MSYRRPPAEGGAREQIEHDMLLGREGGIENPQAPQPVQDAEGAGLAVAPEFPAQFDRRENRKGGVEGRAGVAGMIDRLQGDKPRIAAPHDRRQGHLRRPDQENRQPGQREGDRGQGVGAQLAPAHQHEGRERNVAPEGEVEPERPGLEANQPVDTQNRHHRNGIDREAEDQDVSGKKSGHEDKDARQFEPPQGDHLRPHPPVPGNLPGGSACHCGRIVRNCFHPVSPLRYRHSGKTIR